MPNIVAIVKDDRVRRQIEQYLSELEDEDLHVATFKRSEEFEAIYSQTAAQEPADGAPSRFTEIHLILYSLDSVGGKSSAWLNKTRALLSKNRLLPVSGQVRLVLLKYEDDGISKLDLIDPGLDDLIYLPLDRLIFLQKIDIMLAMPKMTTPRFLFSQDVNHGIEISKIAKVDRLSDVALAIRNPVSLKRGLPGRFYLQLPGEKGRLEIRGKVIRSVPHPDYPGQFLVYFGYFGLDRNALSQIRRALAKAPRYQSLKSEDRESVRFKVDSLFNDPAKERIFSLAIVDPDDAAANSLAGSLTKEMDRLQITTESSYTLFLHKYFQPTGSGGAAAPPKPTDPTDFYAPQISIAVSNSNLKCLTVDPPPNETDLFLGHSAGSLFGATDAWLNPFKGTESEMVLKEAMMLATGGRVLDKLLILLDAENNRRAVNCKIYKGTTDQITSIDLAPANLDDIMRRMTTTETTKTLDVIVVDASFVPEDIEAWIEGLRTRAVQLQMVSDPTQLKFILIADPDVRIKEQWVNSPDILGLFLKPVDTRQLLFYLSEILENKNTLFHFDNVGWSSPTLSVHVAKPVRLEALSEYGATIRSPAKITPGSVFFLRKSIYESAPNNCLAARVYYCAEAQDKEGFQVYATYFGINEAFLKYARTWIRENYAQQKNRDS